MVLFPDTFNNYFDTDVGVACVEAVEAAGWSVIMPEQHVCCGRPLYDFGFLEAAERYLRNVLRMLGPHLHAGTPIVGMEPSCLAVFKDELTKLLPHDNDARRLASSAHHFAEFFDVHDITPPPLDDAGKALLWGHCHQRATGGTDADRKLLEKLGHTTEDLAGGGCCGLAGSWGFEQGKYGISMDCGEQALLPAVRAADPATRVVANGFSCTTQIQHAGTGRDPVHIAELVRRAYQAHDGRTGPAQQAAKPPPAWPRRAARLAVPAALATATALAAGRRAGRPAR
ncbi:(Fe-S)-binding protein [Streptomyces albus]